MITEQERQLLLMILHNVKYKRLNKKSLKKTEPGRSPAHIRNNQGKHTEEERKHDQIQTKATYKP